MSATGQLAHAQLRSADSQKTLGVLHNTLYLKCSVERLAPAQPFLTT